MTVDDLTRAADAAPRPRPRPRPAPPADVPPELPAESTPVTAAPVAEASNAYAWSAPEPVAQTVSSAFVMPTAPVDGRAPYVPLAVHTTTAPPADPSAPIPGAQPPAPTPVGFVAPYVTESYVGGARANDPYGPHGAGYDYPAPRTPVRRGAKSSSALIALLVVALIGCVGVVVAKEMLHNGGSPSGAPTTSISLPPGSGPAVRTRSGLPAAIPGFVQYSDAGTKRLVGAMRTHFGRRNVHAPKGTRIAVYSNVTGTSTRLVVEVLPTSARRIAVGTHVHGHVTNKRVVTAAFAGSGDRVTSVKAGPSGGVMKCAAEDSFGTYTGSLCVWSGKDGIGTVLSVNPRLPVGALAVVTDELRAQLH